VQVCHALQQRANQPNCLQLRESWLAYDAFEQLATLEHLHYDVDVVLALVKTLRNMMNT